MEPHRLWRNVYVLSNYKYKYTRQVWNLAIDFSILENVYCLTLSGVHLFVHLLGQLGMTK